MDGCLKTSLVKVWILILWICVFGLPVQAEESNTAAILKALILEEQNMYARRDIRSLKTLFTPNAVIQWEYASCLKCVERRSPETYLNFFKQSWDALGPDRSFYTAGNINIKVISGGRAIVKDTAIETVKFPGKILHIQFKKTRLMVYENGKYKIKVLKIMEKHLK